MNKQLLIYVKRNLGELIYSMALCDGLDVTQKRVNVLLGKGKADKNDIAGHHIVHISDGFRYITEYPEWYYNVISAVRLMNRMRITSLCTTSIVSGKYGPVDFVYNDTSDDIIDGIVALYRFWLDVGILGNFTHSYCQLTANQILFSSDIGYFRVPATLVKEFMEVCNDFAGEAFDDFIRRLCVVKFYGGKCGGNIEV